MIPMVPRVLSKVLSRVLNGMFPTMLADARRFSLIFFDLLLFVSLISFDLLLFVS